MAGCDNSPLKSDHAQQPSVCDETVWDMIAKIYEGLDPSDCAFVDNGWARMRGYTLPTNGTNTLSPGTGAERAGYGLSGSDHVLDDRTAQDLLPCPFCGEKSAILEKVANAHTSTGFCWRAKCEECWATSHGSYHLDPAGAAKEWNTRHSEAERPSQGAFEAQPQPVAWRWKYKDCQDMKWVIWADYPANEMEIIVEPLYAAAQSSPAATDKDWQYEAGQYHALYELWHKRATQAEAQVEQAHKALEIAEDVLSRAPMSTMIWPNGIHPQAGIEMIRAALSSTQPSASVGGSQ